MTVAALALALLSVSACAPHHEAGVGPLPARRVAIGPVNVTITPLRIDSTSAELAVAFDSHAADVALDIPASATLTVGGHTWPGPTWSGTGPGRHHRSGTLRFVAGGALSGSVVLRIIGLDAPITARWTLPLRDPFGGS